VRSASALGELGFRIVIFPGGTVRFLARQLQGYFATLHRDGSTAALQDRMHDFDGLNALIGTPELLDRGCRYEG
jgi:2-methylisocitrate lyase-like PEP mutase family enzyme